MEQEVRIRASVGEADDIGIRLLVELRRQFQGLPEVRVAGKNLELVVSADRADALVSWLQRRPIFQKVWQEKING